MHQMYMSSLWKKRNVLSVENLQRIDAQGVRTNGIAQEIARSGNGRAINLFVT